MANPANPFQPAIDELEKDLDALEHQADTLRNAINVLRAKAGLPPRPGGSSGAAAAPHGPTKSSSSPLSQIRHDTFFGKRLGTAAREYLEMRKAHGDGPAKPREVFDALKQGGFQFETKDDSVALVSLRAILRKRTEMFQRLPNGTYGLKVWYPNAKKPKATAADDNGKDETTESEAAAPDPFDDEDEATAA